MENYNDITLPWPDWRIVNYLGGGAYGKVYEIERNISGIREKAALKIISRPKDTSEIESYYDNGYDKVSIIASYKSEIQNYVQEYKLMKELKGQSNIVSCDDFTVVPHENGIGGDIFIRMELLTSLQQVLRERKLSEQEIIKLGKDISRALILCESKHIIHRDIKPVNIMLSQFGDYKLGDFGVSKVMDHTTFATVMGTPEYQAPEVVRREKYGQTADIYSLGITLYWLLNNRKMPFIGADEQITPMLRNEAMERRYRGEKLPAPKNGSERLKKIVLKACEYRPEDRYTTAKELYDDLDSLRSEKTANAEKYSRTVDNDWQESETIGKAAFKYEENTNGQTAGNSWSAASETIGKAAPKHEKNEELNDELKEIFKDLFDGDREHYGSETIGKPGENGKQNQKRKPKEEYTQTVGVKQAQEKQEKETQKTTPEKETAPEEKLTTFGLIWCIGCTVLLGYLAYQNLRTNSIPQVIVLLFLMGTELLVACCIQRAEKMGRIMSILVVVKAIKDWCIVAGGVMVLIFFLDERTGFTDNPLLMGITTIGGILILPIYLTYKIESWSFRSRN